MPRHYLEVIPPGEHSPLQREGAEPLISGGLLEGPLSAVFARARARRQARAFRAMTETMEAAKEYFDARRQAIESCIKAGEEEYRLQALADRSTHEAERQRAERSEELHDLQHRHELADLGRERERAEAQAALLASKHALDAQRDLGHDLAWKKRNVELLDIELAVAERRAVLRQHFAEIDQAMRRISSNAPASAGALENALHEARAQLHASGLDTTAIDAALEARRGRR